MKKMLGILLAALILSIYGAVQAADKVRLSVPTFNVMSLTAGVAQQRGFFKEHELEAEIIGMTPPVSIMALANEDLGYTMVFGSVVRGTLRGLPLKVIACFLDSPTVTLIAHARYKSVKDLKGRTLGISAFGATPHLLA
ncbi:MAG: ABC transporter substrate-binding protein, partial [Deltaproteobacteria bacterium]|nr:ABC transporter substrate-binding protein [Deltaproteobacteria bacterium]